MITPLSEGVYPIQSKAFFLTLNELQVGCKWVFLGLVCICGGGEGCFLLFLQE